MLVKIRQKGVHNVIALYFHYIIKRMFSFLLFNGTTTASDSSLNSPNSEMAEKSRFSHYASFQVYLIQVLVTAKGRIEFSSYGKLVFHIIFDGIFVRFLLTSAPRVYNHSHNKTMFSQALTNYLICNSFNCCV